MSRLVPFAWIACIAIIGTTIGYCVHESTHAACPTIIYAKDNSQ